MGRRCLRIAGWKRCIWLCLDVKCRLIQAVKMAEGTIDKVPIGNREIIRAALSVQAKNVLLMHNHPSGSLRPTTSDIDLTRKIMQALESIEVALLDHLIIGANGYFSFMKNDVGQTRQLKTNTLMYAAEDEYRVHFGEEKDVGFA